jgi:short-subunit dehydrogenase
MTTDKTLVLITGGKWQSEKRYQTTSLTISANSGIELEWASQLMAKGPYHILIGARSTNKGKAAVQELRLKGYKGTCELLQLDQTDDASVAAAARRIEITYDRLDVLINNAAVASEEMTCENMISDFNTNVMFFTVCPGFTVSNLGPQNNAEYGAKPTDEAVRPLLKIVERDRDEEAKEFLHADGRCPW